MGWLINPMEKTTQNQEFIDFIQELANASGEIIRRYFRSGIAVETKSDQTPVTIADRRAEETMRQLIQARYPGHGILGEEFAEVNPGAEYQWILDPIDGTKTFVSGTYLFGTLIALLRDGKPILGAINNPIVNQFLVGDGSTTWLNGVPVKVRDCPSLDQATLLTTSPLTLPGTGTEPPSTPWPGESNCSAPGAIATDIFWLPPVTPISWLMQL